MSNFVCRQCNGAWPRLADYEAHPCGQIEERPGPVPADLCADAGAPSAPRSHPFMVAAYLTKQDRPGVITRGARGGIRWGANEDEARGALVREFLAAGWTIEILQLQPIGPECRAQIAKYHAEQAR